MPRSPKQAVLDFRPRRVSPPGQHGGARPGAGRPRTKHPRGHLPRPRFAGRFPLHVTLRLHRDVPSVRRGRAVRVIWRVITAAHRDDFRIVEFVVLPNHLHLIVEAENADVLARRMQGFCIRLARNLNAHLNREGTFFAERYHLHVLRTPTEVRNALRYVLSNLRHHCSGPLARDWPDPYSSAVWFDGWAPRARFAFGEPRLKELRAHPPPTLPATRWLLTTGWRRWGALEPDEAPRGHGRQD